MASKFVCLFLLLAVVRGQWVEQGYEHTFTSVPDEMTNVPMNCTGKAPLWLNGSLYRVGPAMFELGHDNKSKVTNTLDGFAKIAHWNFMGNGTILFSTRFLNSTYYTESLLKQKFTSTVFVSAVEPELTPAEVQRSLEVGIDNMDINLVDFPDKDATNVTLVATNDIWSVYEILLDENLATGRKLTPPVADAWETAPQGTPAFMKRLSTSHPLPEPNTENLINIILLAAVNPGEKHMIKVVRIKSLYETEVIASWEVDELPLVHSFVVTESKVIFVENPYHLNVSCMLKNTGDCYYWKTGTDNVTLYVVDIPTGNVKEIPIEKIFVYHHINGYHESEKKIVVDVASYSSPVAYTKFSLEELEDPVSRQQIEPKADMKRICVHLENNTATVYSVPSPTQTSEIASTLDYPVINEANRSTSYCYVYGIVEKLDGMKLGSMGVAKKDLCTKDGRHADAVYQRIGWYPSEPTFVPTPGATAEDDGILLVPYTSGPEKLTHLVILNATDLTFVDIARGPLLIPQSQHGKYFDSL